MTCSCEVKILQFWDTSFLGVALKRGCACFKERSVIYISY